MIYVKRRSTTMKNILFALGILVLVGCVMDASAATATNLV